MKLRRIGVSKYYVKYFPCQIIKTAEGTIIPSLRALVPQVRIIRDYMKQKNYENWIKDSFIISEDILLFKQL